MYTFLRTIVLIALTAVGWAAFRIMVEDMQQADPLATRDRWADMTVFGELPERDEDGDPALIARRWLVRHVNEVQWVIPGAGLLLILLQFRGGKRGNKRACQGRGKWRLGTALIRWSRQDSWTFADSFQGLFICGANGSGKTSGSGKAVALAFLAQGFGGLVLTAKSEEVQLWQDYCRQTGREKDLIIFGPGHPHRFDPFDWEVNRPGAGAGQTEEVVRLIMAIMEMADRGSGQGGGREEEGFWKRALAQLARNGVEVLILGTGSVSIPNLYRLIVSAPTSMEQVRSPEWRQGSFCFQCLQAAEQRVATPSQVRDLELVADYFLCEFPALSEKTRSVIVASLTSMVDVFNRGDLRELFCSGTNLLPTAAEQGKVIVMGTPVKEYGQGGLLAQVAFKYPFQRSIERRDVKKSPRPVFLWEDECQYFLSRTTDMQFLTTCRSARVANVYLTQNVNNLYAALGGPQTAKAEADSILGCLNTKIWHANSCPITNEFAASLIGRTRQFFINASSSNQEDWVAGVLGNGNPPHSNGGVSESFEYELQPAEFTTLRQGGPENDFQVEGVVFQNGKIFADTGRTWRYATFDQRQK